VKYCFCFCGLVARVPGYRSGDPGFDSRHYKKKRVLGLERGPLSLVSVTEELLGSNSSGSSLERRKYGSKDLYIYIVWRRAREPILPVTSYFYIKLTSRFNFVLLINFSLFEHLHFSTNTEHTQTSMPAVGFEPTWHLLSAKSWH
jgi:hypothetical protein